MYPFFDPDCGCAGVWIHEDRSSDNRAGDSGAFPDYAKVYVVTGTNENKGM